MLGISLHDDYLSFAAVTDDADSRVIDQTGVIDFPFRFTKKDLLSDACVQDLIQVFKELKNSLDFPQNKSRLSIPAHLASIRIKQSDEIDQRHELKEYQRWESAVHIGQDNYDLLKKQQMLSDDDKGLSCISVFFYPKIINHILEAAEFVRLGIRGIDVNPFSAYETVKKNYDISNYERHSLIHFQTKNLLSVSIYDNKRFLKYALIHLTPKGPVFYSYFDAELYKIGNLLLEKEWDNSLFDYLGPSFVYASKNSIEPIWDKVENTYFMELVNPFVEYEIFKHHRIVDHDNEALSDNLFVEVAGTLFRGIQEND